MNLSSKQKAIVVSIAFLMFSIFLIDVQNALVAYLMESYLPKLSPMYFVSSDLPIYRQVLVLFSVLLWLASILAKVLFEKWSGSNRQKTQK